ncbi:hypothetical protein [Ilumatobacter sp.]|uniref:hypothetical protein n=1 Tax=Ilumatobacter sp. TaxID=1967498 RepID=UPI00375210BA
MRQLFTWRFVAALAALAGLAILINAVVVDDDQLAGIVESEVPNRKIDLISPVFFMETSDDFGFGDDGLTDGFIDFVLPSRKVMRVAPGTPGNINCDLQSLNRCVVFVDLLGEAVIWFATLPKAEGKTVELPPIVDLEDGLALFENGWQIRYPPVIDRFCAGEDIVSFSDFLRRFGPGSTSVVDLETQLVIEVRCAGTEAPDVTTTTVERSVDLPVGNVPVTSIDQLTPLDETVNPAGGEPAIEE